MDGSRRNWLITGSTGFVGRELVYHLLSNTTDSLTLLCRNSSHIARDRIRRRLAEIDPAFEPDWNRLQFTQVDLTKTNLGMSSSSIERLYRYNNQFIHLAASTSFTNTLEKARLINVEGTKNAFGLAKRLYENKALSCFSHVSTAYVQGHRKDIVAVEEPLSPSRTRNTYEQSKCEAELWVRENRNLVPTVIFRPSIVVGDSNTGRSSGIATIYWAVKMALSGHRRFFAHPGARLDMVPVNYVIETMLALSNREDSVGKCYPLVAGIEQDQPLSRLAEAVVTELSLPKVVMYRPTIPMRFAAPIRIAAWLAGKAKFADQMLAYLPYFSENPRFDNEPTRTALIDSGISLPAFDDYIGLLLRSFAQRQGKDPVISRLTTR